MSTTTRRMLHRLLAYAFIDLRTEGHDNNNKLVFLLADLFHNVPSQLEMVDQGECTLDDIMQWLNERAKKNGLEGWLEVRTEEASKY